MSSAAPARPPEETHAAPRTATVAYAGPFLVFIACLLLQRMYPSAPAPLQVVRTVLVTAIVALVSLRHVRILPSAPLKSTLAGIAVFLVWIGPDLLWPGYRTHWLFQNGVTGTAASSIPDSLRANFWFIALRVTSSTVLVPILEELFWRGWMMRWLVRGDFVSVPLGTYTAESFWIVALLFASEHGPYWDVGLIAGIAYNWWLVRRRNLGDCILAHGVTNGCLAGYVLLRGEWQYWL